MREKQLKISLRDVFVVFGDMYQAFLADYEKVPRVFCGYYTFFDDVIVQDKVTTLVLRLENKHYDRSYMYNNMRLCMSYDRDTKEVKAFFSDLEVNPKLLFIDFNDAIIKMYVEIGFKHYKFLKLFSAIEDAKLVRKNTKSIHIDFATDPFCGIHYIFFANDYATLNRDLSVVYDKMYLIEKEPRFQAAASNLIAMTGNITREEFEKKEYDDILGRVYIPDILYDLKIDSKLC